MVSAAATGRFPEVEQIVIPALVAAIVTLGIEYFAKPQLEARKERILARARTRAEVHRQVQRIGYFLGYLDGTDNVGAPVRGQAREDLAAALVALDEVLIECPPRPSEAQEFDRIPDLRRECRQYLSDGRGRGSNGCGQGQAASGVHGRDYRKGASHNATRRAVATAASGTGD